HFERGSNRPYPRTPGEQHRTGVWGYGDWWGRRIMRGRWGPQRDDRRVGSVPAGDEIATDNVGPRPRSGCPLLGVQALVTSWTRSVGRARPSGSVAGGTP